MIMPFGDKEKMKQARIQAQKDWKIESSHFVRTESEKIAEYFSALPDTFKKLWHRCYTGKSSKPEALKAKCYDCSAGDREEIKNCAVKTCPLWHHRPFKNKG